MRHAILLVIISLLYGCAPTFSELQTARTVGKGNFEFTPSYSSVGFTSEGEKDRVQNHAGIQAAYGINERLDIRLRYEYVWPSGDSDASGVSMIGIGPKYSLLQNRIALYVPIGRAFGEEDLDDSWQMHPTLLLTQPLLKDKIDLYLAPKYLITFCDECDDLFAVNAGFAFSNNLSSWSIKPEYGMLFNFGEEGYFSHFSIGFSKTF